jgi:chorismate lyase/3-hydroxybenzoate synthase
LNRPSTLVPAGLPPLAVALGAGPDARLEPGLPVLAGAALEDLFGRLPAAGQAGPFALFQSADWLIGGATIPTTGGLEAATHQLYTALFAAVGKRHLARIWHYVPGINATGPGGLENYRAFCRARSLVFEERLGRGFKSLLPAASAVGSKAPALTLVFAACTAQPRHHENPLQVAAYDYPADYGPRAPSFARATVVPGSSGRTIFISGTAAIRGHATVAPHDLDRQLTCAVENLREISRACGLGPDLAGARAALRHFKVYLRHAADQPAAAEFLQEQLFVPADHVSYVHADICRDSLVVEIEATLLGA